MKQSTLLVLLLLTTAAQAECDKLAILDAKALSQEELQRRICRDMEKRNAYVDSANSFTTKADMVYTFNGLKFVSPRNSSFYYGWLGQLKQANVCHDAMKSNTETYNDLYNSSPGCGEPNVAERLELGP